MSEINNYIVLGSVLLTSIWSIVCLKKTGAPADNSKEIRPDPENFFSRSRITAEGILSMEPPLEQLRSADI